MFTKKIVFRISVVALIVLVWLLRPDPSLAQDRPPTTRSQPIQATRNAAGILVTEDGKPVLQYQAKPKSINGQYRRANYVHPVYDIRGNVLTEDFPEDHLHHRGIFWAWHQVHVDGIPAGDSWLAQDFQWEVVDSEFTPVANHELLLKTSVQWTCPKITGTDGKRLVIVNETTRITIHPTSEQQRLIDFEICLLAAVPNVSLGGSDDEKGYGGFSVRLAPPSDLEFLTSGGEIKPKNTAVNGGDWVDFVGTFGTGETKSGVAVFVHPTSAGYPQRWILRAEKSMQNPVFPGRTKVPMSQTSPTVLRYRIAIHQNSLTTPQLERLFNDYRKSTFAETGDTDSNSRLEPN